MIRTCGDKDFTECVQTESEQRPSAASVFLDWNVMQARPGDAGFHRQRHGESQEREQCAQFVRVGQVSGLCVPNIRCSMDAESRRGKFAT